MCLMPKANSNLENKNFESFKYNILDATEDILLDNSCYRDSNYFNTAIKTLIPQEFHSQFKDHISNTLSFLHINTRRTLKI